MLLLCPGGWFALALLGGLTGTSLPVDYLLGAGAGAVLGVVLLALGTVTSSRVPALVASLSVVALVTTFVLTQRLGAHAAEATLRRAEKALPAVEQIIRADILANAGPIEWSEPGWHMAGPSVVALGEAHSPPASVRIEFRPDAIRSLRTSRGAKGLRLALELWLPQARDLWDGERRNPETVRGLLLSMGVAPELVASLRVPQPGTTADAGVDYHGLAYSVIFNTYRGRQCTTVIRCYGTHSSVR